MRKYDGITLNGTPLTTQEVFVLNQVEQGAIADLREQFGEEEESRCLRAKFLEALLTDDITIDTQKFTPHRRGIRIRHAVISQPLDLENAEVSYLVELDSCVLEEQVTLLDACFQRHLSLNGTKFLQEAFFHRLSVRGNLFLRNAVFKGPVDFGWADIGGHISADAAQFGEEQKGLKANFNGLKVGSHAIFQGSQFNGPVDFMVSRIGGSLHFAPFEEEGNVKIPTRFSRAALFKGAYIEGELRAQQAEFLSKDQEASFNSIVVGQNANFQSARFHGPVNFGGADIKGQLAGQQAEFLSKDQKANFNRLKVGKIAFLQGVQFHGPVDFSAIKVEEHFDLRPWQEHGLKQATVFKGAVKFDWAEIGGHFMSYGATFENEKDEISFIGLKVHQLAFFDKAIFYGPLNCHRMHVDLSLSFQGSIFQKSVNFSLVDIVEQFNCEEAGFLNEEETANFNGIKVGQDASFMYASFNGPAEFTGAYIGRQLNIQRAIFNNSEKEVNFNSIKVCQSAKFDQSTFCGPVNFDVMEITEHFSFKDVIFEGMANFNGARIGGQFNAVEANFCNKEKMASFNTMKVGSNAVFNNAIFKGSVEFGSAEITGQFNADGARFENEYCKVNFHAMKVGNSAFFRSVKFQGPVDFSAVQIEGQFSAGLAQFKSQEGAQFEGLKVGKSVIFRGADFAGPVFLNHAHFLDLQIDGMNITELYIEHTLIDRELLINNTGLGKIIVRNLTVQGPATLEKVTITSEADLRGASFQSLDLLQVRWPKNSEKVWLEGLTYQAVSPGTKPEDISKLLAWVEGSRFSPQPYYEMEHCFQRHGNKDWADKVFLALKKRQSREYPGILGLFLWTWTWFLIGLVGYGRKPLRSFTWILLLFCVGFHFFGDPADMIPKKGSTLAVFSTPAITGLYTEKDKIIEEKGFHHYHWFYYTLDLMLPIDIEIAKYYEPKYALGRLFARVLPLAGWIIFAALAASLTGLFETKGGN